MGSLWRPLYCLALPVSWLFREGGKALLAGAGVRVAGVCAETLCVGFFEPCSCFVAENLVRGLFRALRLFAQKTLWGYFERLRLFAQKPC